MNPSSELLQLRVVWGRPSDLQSVLEVMTVLGTVRSLRPCSLVNSGHTSLTVLHFTSRTPGFNGFPLIALVTPV